MLHKRFTHATFLEVTDGVVGQLNQPPTVGQRGMGLPDLCGTFSAG